MTTLEPRAHSAEVPEAPVRDRWSARLLASELWLIATRRRREAV